MAREFAVADCETDPFKIGRVPVPFVWGYFDGEKYIQFHNTQQFVAYIRDLRIIIYAHNGGKFDWHFILAELEPYSDIMIVNGRIAKCTIGSCELRDSYSILPVPLAAYKKDEIDYGIFEKELRDKPENWKKITEYLRSDCIYLYELVSAFISKFGLQITQASAAMKQWQKISKKPLPKSSKEYFDELVPYYYGGRVECFESGIIETDFSVYDINSAYPFAMLEEHPYSIDYSHIDGYCDDADFYKVRCVSRGAFPYRGEGDPNEFAGLRFPNDSEIRTFTVTGWEYVSALETNTISKIEVLESIVFNEHISFREYIEYFYEQRLKAIAEKNDAESLFCKLLMNGLYGKFAANPENYKNYMVVPMDVIAGLGESGWSFAGEIGPWGLAEAPLAENQQRYYNVATSASITGFVRAMLWRAIHSSERVLYCDTDSIAVSGRGAAVALGKRLGDWKHEGDFDKAGIAGKKLYIFRGVPDIAGNRVHKAASKGARLTYAELWEVAKGGEVYFTPEVPTFSVTKAPVFTSRRIKFTASSRSR